MSSSQAQLWMEPFSPREREILRLISDGMSNREIAARLHLSLDTVKWYNKQVFSKLGVSSRIQAARKAADLGLIELDEASTVSETGPPRHNLPALLTSFVGRNREVAEISGLLAASRLVTLTGPGGSGKTRLALEIARSLVRRFPDGVWLIELAPLTDPATVAAAVAQTLNIPLGSDVLPVEILKQRLSRKRLMLLLDNFEHLLPAAPMVGEILSAAPQVVVLATSRERLNIYGEREYPVMPLSLPDSRQRATPASALESEAVQLFIDRAQTVHPDFILDSQQIQSVIEICARLDGLPLAIELAASHTRIFPPVLLAQRLRDRLGALPAGPRDAPDRQRTLQATIGWSYGLLDEEEKSLFARLSIFQGGATLEAIERVCLPGLSGNPAEALSHLVEKSLVVSRPDPLDSVRFGMLETIREFARDKLREAGETEALHERHALFFAELAERAESEIRGKRHLYWFGRLRVEHENLRHALRWSLDGDHPEAGLRIVAALIYFWYYGGHIFEAQEWCRLALDRSPQAAPRLQAGVLRAAGWFREFGESSGGLGLLLSALEIFRKQGDDRNVAFTLAQSATGLIFSDGDFQRAFVAAQEAFETFSRLEDEEGLAYSLNNLGELSRLIGDYDAAKRYYERSLETALRTGELLRVPIQHANLTYIAYHRRDYVGGVDFGRKALVAFQELGNEYGVISVLANIAGCLTPLGEAERASELLGANEALLGSIGAQRQNVDRSQISVYIAEAKEQLGDAEFVKAWQHGQELTLEEAVALALKDS